MEKLAQELLATLRESLLVLDHNLRVQFASDSFYRTFKVERAEVENQQLYELGDGQWDFPALRAALEESMVHGTPLDDFVVKRDFPRIGHRFMSLNVRHVKHEDGVSPLILLAIENVTKQHQADAMIQQYIHKLEWSNRELEDFAYIASHDLQEPLRAIQSFSDRLQSKHAQTLDAKGLDYLARIQRAAGRMRLLISDLLVYSRVTTQGKPFERVDLEVMARECIADLAQRIQETKGSVTVGPLPTIEADPVQMRQLLQNLLDNGLKFHRDGIAPRVTIEANGDANDAAGMETSLPGRGLKVERCQIVVEDNGIGFDEKYKDRIYSPFERLHNQKKYPGTGIGLAVCRRIVERHGGRLTATSVPGQGTSFLIVLPLYQSQQVLAVENKDE